MNINQLRTKIDKADAAYYRTKDALYTDEEYDNLKAQLKELDSQDERLTRVGPQYSFEELRTKINHAIPMGSLDNTSDGILGFASWCESLKKKLIFESWCESLKTLKKKSTDDIQLEFVVSPKIDGSSICATYQNGKLVRVLTRGNGEVGEDITANAMMFAYLPTTIKLLKTIHVRGEAILHKADFEKICDRDNIAVKDRSNPRNVGNGIIGRDSGKDCGFIRFYPFDVDGLNVESEMQKRRILATIGFTPIPHQVCDQNQFNGIYNSIANNRDKLPFEIDGVVIILNSLEHQKLFVTNDINTKLRPKYARAVKFPHKAATTTINDVLLTVGHTRAIVPTAILEEVRIGGVNVTHALLNNWDEIDRLGVAIGDVVEVVLAGDIVPKILRLVKKGQNRKVIAEPSHCPECGDNATRDFRGQKGAVTYCSNETCPAAMREKINHWIGSSKKGVGILGIGDGILAKMWDEELINDPADLYVLTVGQLKDLELDGGMRVGDSRAKMIVDNIKSKSSLSLPVFLGSLGIDLLGRRRVQILMDAADGELDTLDGWLDVEKLSTIQLPGFGDTIKAAVIDGIKRNVLLIEKLLANGVTVAMSNKLRSPEISKPFSGLSFCLTGTRACVDDIEKLGGTVKSGVSKTLNYLVQADPLSISNKTQKAEQYGVKIISLDRLRRAISGEEPLG